MEDKKYRVKVFEVLGDRERPIAEAWGKTRDEAILWFIRKFRVPAGR